MTTLSGFPYIEAQFDKQQQPLEGNQTQTIAEWVGAEGITDLLVLSHGWNNDIAEARDLYARLTASIAARIASGSGGGLPDRTLGVLGILWPSKKFADEELIPGGAAAAGGDVEDDAVIKELERLKGFFDAGGDQQLDALVNLVGDLDTDPAARAAFFRGARSLMNEPDELDEDDRDEVPDAFFDADSDDEIADIFAELKKPDPPGVSTIPTMSGAAGISLSGFKAGARRLLNFVTYYKMKDRARRTGVSAVAPMLRGLRNAHSSLQLHLVGHSFGGLVVTSATWGSDSGMPRLPIASLSLLQAAFSHNGFADDFVDGKDGRYRNVLSQTRVAGPILVTHTHNDKAVGVAYALASRLSREDAAAFGVGDADDRFGGIGANGAQHTPERIQGVLRDPGFQYHFTAGKLYNLLADDHVSDHSDVTGDAIAHAVVEAIDSVPNGTGFTI